MIFDAWRAVTCQCATQVAECTRQVHLMMQEAMEEDVIADAQRILDLKMNLLDAIVAAYLKELRDGLPRD